MRERGVIKKPDGLLSYRPLACSLVVLVSASFSSVLVSPAFHGSFLSSFALEISLAIISAIRTGVHGSFLSGFALEISLAIICAIRTAACFRQAEVPYCRRCLYLSSLCFFLLVCSVAGCLEAALKKIKN